MTYWQALLGVGAPADCPGIHDQTALHKAAMNGQANRVALLLQFADPWHRDSDGMTPLDLAVTDIPDNYLQGEFEKTRELLDPALRKPTPAKRWSRALEGLRNYSLQRCGASLLPLQAPI